MLSAAASSPAAAATPKPKVKQYHRVSRSFVCSLNDPEVSPLGTSGAEAKILAHIHSATVPWSKRHVDMGPAAMREVASKLEVGEDWVRDRVYNLIDKGLISRDPTRPYACGLSDRMYSDVCDLNRENECGRCGRVGIGETFFMAPPELLKVLPSKCDNDVYWVVLIVSEATLFWDRRGKCLYTKQQPIPYSHFMALSGYTDPKTIRTALRTAEKCGWIRIQTCEGMESLYEAIPENFGKGEQRARRSVKQPENRPKKTASEQQKGKTGDDPKPQKHGLKAVESVPPPGIESAPHRLVRCCFCHWLQPINPPKPKVLVEPSRQQPFDWGTKAPMRPETERPTPKPDLEIPAEWIPVHEAMAAYAPFLRCGLPSYEMTRRVWLHLGESETTTRLDAQGHTPLQRFADYCSSPRQRDRLRNEGQSAGWIILTWFAKDIAELLKHERRNQEQAEARRAERRARECDLHRERLRAGTENTDMLDLIDGEFPELRQEFPDLLWAGTPARLEKRCATFRNAIDDCRRRLGRCSDERRPELKRELAIYEKSLADLQKEK